MCFIEMKNRAVIYQHCSQKHIPKDYVDLRYPFKVEEMAIITSGDEDRYDKDVDPRNLPLRPGILIPRDHQPVDGNTPSGLEWYVPARDARSREAGPSVPFASPMTTKRMKIDPALDCRFCRKDCCYIICGSASMEVASSAATCVAMHFQMQASINADAPLPLPTPNDRIRLMGAYDSSPTRGYLNAYQYTRLAKKMGVRSTSAWKWFSDERMRQGHHMEYTKYSHRPGQEEGETTGSGGEDTTATTQGKTVAGTTSCRVAQDELDPKDKGRVC